MVDDMIHLLLYFLHRIFPINFMMFHVKLLFVLWVKIVLSRGEWRRIERTESL